MASILVTGGTGNLGRHVVPLLRGRGHDVRVLSRSAHAGREFVVGDTFTGAGLDAAFAGVDTVLHLAGSNKGDEIGAGHVADAARTAGVGHVVLISVTGADALPLAYFRSKDRSEHVVAASGVPYTVLRAAQFHDFAWTVFGGLMKSPIVPAPAGVRFETVDVADVAARLAELVDGAPAGRVPDIAGPEVIEVPTMLRQLASARGLRRSFLPVHVPGAMGRAYRDGANLAGSDALRGALTWSEYLALRAAVPAAA
ncbi:SDR family oxidoreductase [Microbacterium sp. ASV49]|uniref:NAD(P)H-binding protein n=1 Tax=Microbacterium candidum TaxID=3041922 RepID=A0ABT7N468_9MICO|nr:NAD(P)H-binding protein [Microbacterium sp. ASV49]MDL9981494.1 NAD(P)H-binding protein [Microbacterium sp. ASV49]